LLMGEPHVVDFGDYAFNMNWVMNYSVRAIEKDREEDTQMYSVTFYFGDGRGSYKTVTLTEDGLDTLREAMV
jgi:hypothetical protein